MAATESVPGSTRETVLSSPLATHTEPGTEGDGRGPGTDWNLLAGLPAARIDPGDAVAGGLVTHTEPAPKATPNGGEASGIVAVSCPETGLSADSGAR